MVTAQKSSPPQSAANSQAKDVERRTRAFLDQLAAAGGEPMETLTPDEARQVLVGAQETAGVALPPAKVEKRSIEVDGRSVPLIIVKPANATGTLPAFMFIHGGGWVIGDFPTHERFVRDLVTLSGAAAVFVEYDRSPEVRFPVAINQAFAATKWVAEHGAEIGVDGSRLAVVGNSVGGNMAAAVALMANRDRAPKLRSLVLFWPVTDANFDTESYHDFADGYFLTRSMMQWFWDSYLPDADARRDFLASPLQATTEQLRGLPPTLVQTAEFDVLRDEGEAFARKLDAAGVDVVNLRVNGMIHDYGLLNALAHVPAVQTALEQAATRLAKQLK
jgi:acetyl esterase